MNSIDPNLLKAAETAVKTCLGVKSSEAFLVITDTETREIGEALAHVGFEIGAETMLVVMKPRTKHGEEPPKPVAEMWRYADVFIAPTKYSLSHTQARKKATEVGARGATMPGITRDIFVETMNADYLKIKDMALKMSEALKGVNVIRVTSPFGTDVVFSIEGRPVLLDTGILHEKGAFGNLPAGEVFVAPVEGTAEGVIVFDASVASVGLLKNPIKISVKKGFAVEIKGAEEASKLRELLGSVKRKEAYNIAEFGIGCNTGARVVGNILEDEKVFGTIHIALGDNSTIGGKTVAGIHLDGIITKPTVYADNKKIIENGVWII